MPYRVPLSNHWTRTCALFNIACHSRSLYKACAMTESGHVSTIPPFLLTRLRKFHPRRTSDAPAKPLCAVAKRQEMNATPPQRWDIFCRVVDNYGDIGVCWRLARQLASEYRLQVRLWVDELAALQA